MQLYFKRSLALLVLIIVSVGVCFGKQDRLKYTVQKYSISEGISNNNIYDILEDSRGYLWIATENGLNRFDGKEFAHFFPVAGDTSSINSNFIRRIAEDHKGDIWIATKGGGVNRYKYHDNKFDHFTADNSPISSNYISAVASNGRIVWIANERNIVDYLDLKTGKWEKIDLNKRLGKTVGVECLLSYNGRLFIGTQGDGFWEFIPKEKILRQFKNKDASNQNNWIKEIQHNTGRIFTVTTFGGQLYDVDLGTELYYRVGAPRSSNNLIYSILRDSRGYHWFGGFGYGYADDWSQQPELIESFSDKRYYLYQRNQVTCMIEDRMGQIWIGTKGPGLIQIQCYRDFFTHVKPKDLGYAQENNKIDCITECKNGEIWAGTDDGIVRFNQELEVVGNYANRFMPGYNVFDLLEVNTDTFLIATWHNGLFLATHSGNRLKIEDHFFDKKKKLDKIPEILRLNNDSILIGTYNGGAYLYRCDKKDDPLSLVLGSDSLTAATHDSYNGFYTDRLGRLWVSSHGYGVLRFSKSLKLEKIYTSNPQDDVYLPGGYVYGIVQDSEGKIWTGGHQGLTCVYPDSCFHVAQNISKLRDPNIWCMIPSGKDIWMATNNGISRFASSEGVIHNFDLKEELKGSEFRYKAMLQLQDGRLLFGSKHSGVFALHPDSAVIKQYEVHAVVDAVEKNGIVQTDYAELEGGKKDVWHVNVSLIDLNMLYHSTVEWRLKGADEIWHTITDDESIILQGLSSGDYQLQVRVKNGNGYIAPVQDLLSFTISNNSWIWILIVITIVAGAIVYWVKQKQQSNKDDIVEEDNNKERYAYLDVKSSETLKVQLLNFMKENQPYLDQEFSLKQLAENMDIKESVATELLNMHIGIRFQDFTNQYRIEEAKRLLLEDMEMNAEQIGYQCGFNSRSAFYRSFKKFTGITPLQFRKENDEK
ncbi:helix-turn-helix domain-containing protein [Puteibacter caeruleilacunae]|nr:helix-turn-helix domain-containing protein [Puteibacter caeruleilacunae]